MKLLEIGPDFKVLLNKDWLLLIPQFKRLIHRDKGSPGDNDGRKKYRAIKELTYIYHVSDPRSPIENIDDAVDRQKKALQYAELAEKDIDKDVLDALTEYEYLLSISVPTLELLRAAKGSKQQLISYFRTIDFSQRDVRGAMVHSPMQHIKNISLLKTLHKDLIEFESMVHDELKENKGTRGKTELGDKEQSGVVRKWDEGSADDGPTVDPYAEFNEQETQIKLKDLNAKAPSFFKITELNAKID